MKLRVILPAVGVGCCLLAPACAVFPKRIPHDLRQPQPRQPVVAPGTEATDTMTWQQPVLDKPNPPIKLTSGSSISRCGGSLGTLFSEYRDVNGTGLQLIHGTAAASEFSGNDFWGTHRYKDWNMLLVVEPDDESFLSTANSFSQGGWEDDGIASYLYVHNPDLDQLVELEWDTGFFAPQAAPRAGDETLAVGRWILDCGHESFSKDIPPKSIGFRAEFHAPAIVLSSHVSHADPTSVQAEFRAFAGSRSGPMDVSPVFLFFILKFFASHKTPLGGQDYSVNLHAPGNGWKIASCTTAEGYHAGGWPHRIGAQVKSDGTSLTLTIPAHSLKPTARIESSTIVDVSWVREDSSSGGGITQCQPAPAKH